MGTLSGTIPTFLSTELCCTHNSDDSFVAAVAIQFLQPFEVPDFLIQFGVSGDADQNWKYEVLLSFLRLGH